MQGTILYYIDEEDFEIKQNFGSRSPKWRLRSCFPEDKVVYEVTQLIWTLSLQTHLSGN